VIASGGVFLRPQLIKEIRDNAGNVVCKFGREEMHHVISRKTAQTVALMLTGVTRKKEGTAPEAAIDGYDVAGKTGTTQKLVEETMPNGTTKLVYSKKHHVASFVGFFPAGDPQVAISVIVDDADHRAPNGVAYGAKVAAPSFKRIGERLIPILDIKAANRSDRSAVIAANEGALR
jgi:cell division protein FtsI/penicillin-binding protein 2